MKNDRSQPLPPVARAPCGQDQPPAGNEPARRQTAPGAGKDQSFTLHPVHLIGFDGPLDLLLFLVKDSQLDISSISIAAIADQYLEFIYLLPLLTPPELEGAADFLAVAAILAWMKSKSLLPTQEEAEEEKEEEAAAEELMKRLKEYERFTEPADWLWNRFRQFRLMFPRGLLQEQSSELNLGDISLFDLATAFQELLEKAKPQPPTEVSPSKINIQESMKEIILRLRSSPQPLTLNQLLGEDPTRIAILSCFLAILELVKGRSIRVSQSSPYGPITVALTRGQKPSGQR
jgi:segregation and condensation protein A